MASLGQKLREVRVQNELTEEEVSTETCIPLGIIRSLEVDDYSSFDSPVYAKNFLKTYSSFLGLNISEVLAKFNELKSDSETIFKPNRQRLENTVRPEVVERSRNPLILGPVLIGIFGFLCFCLFSLFTGGSLPFAPTHANAEEPSQAAAQVSGASEEIEEEPVVTPVRLIEPEEATAEGGGGGGAYVDDFHASTTTETIFLPASKKKPVHAVLP